MAVTDPGSPKTILLVEDEAIIALSTKMFLHKYGFNVIIAGTGEEAVELVDDTPTIDLILMDINLGNGIDGTEAARKILADHDIPLVFHSSHTEPSVVEKTEGITSYGYIVKNSGETVLIASIKMAFRLWESEAKFRTAFERVAVGMVLTSPQGELLRVNEAFASMLGYTPHEIFPLNFACLTHPDDVELSIDQMKSLLRGDAYSCCFTKRYIHKGGHTVWTDISTVLLRDSFGHPVHFITHVQNVSELKHAVTALADSKERLASILKAVPTGIGVVQGTDRVIIDANERLCTMLGYTREELVGRSASILYASYEEFERAGRDKYKQIAAHGTGAVETRWKRKDGSILDIHLASAPIYPSDLSRGVTFSALDIGTYKVTVVRQAIASTVPPIL